MDRQLTRSPEKELCPICQEHLREPLSTDCGHFFCRVCLIQQARKASDGDILNCSVCRKPWSPSLLGEGYSCENHQKLVSWFCEEKELFLCSQCRTSPEHRTHQALPLDLAITHYKERLQRKVRKLQKFLGEPQHLPEEKQKLHTLLKQVDSEKDRLEALLERQQTGGQLGSPLQQWLDRLNSISEEVKELQDKISEAETQITELEAASKALNISLLKNARDLLSRSVPGKLGYLKDHSSVLEHKVGKLLQQISTAQELSPSVNAPTSELCGSHLLYPPPQSTCRLD